MRSWPCIGDCCRPALYLVRTSAHRVDYTVIRLCIWLCSTVKQGPLLLIGSLSAVVRTNHERSVFFRPLQHNRTPRPGKGLRQAKPRLRHRIKHVNNHVQWALVVWREGLTKLDFDPKGLSRPCLCTITAPKQICARTYSHNRVYNYTAQCFCTYVSMLQLYC